MLGFFPIAGAPIADVGIPANINGGAAGGSAAGTASGQVAGTAPVTTTATLASTGARVIGAGNALGTSLLTAFQLMGALSGTSASSAKGQVAGGGAASGKSLLATIQALLIASGGSIFGSTNIIAYAFYPAYTKWNPETLLFLFDGELINESDSAFEQSGRVVFCAERTVHDQAEVWLYWFDPIFGRFLFEKICLGSNPRVILDDPLNTVTSDILLFYVTPVEQRICYRQQRDRYLIEYQTPLVKDPHSYIDLYIQDAVKSRDGRLVILAAQRSIQKGQWSYVRLESALYPFVIDVDGRTAAQQFLNTSTLALARIILAIEPDSRTTSIAFQAVGTLRSVIIFSGPPGTLNPVGSPVPFYDDVESFQAAAVYQSGIFLQVLFPHSTFDNDAFQAASVFESGTLVKVVIVIVLYDIDEFQAASTFVAAGSSLA